MLKRITLNFTEPNIYADYILSFHHPCNTRLYGLKNKIKTIYIYIYISFLSKKMLSGIPNDGLVQIVFCSFQDIKWETATNPNLTQPFKCILFHNSLQNECTPQSCLLTGMISLAKMTCCFSLMTKTNRSAWQTPEQLVTPSSSSGVVQGENNAHVFSFHNCDSSTQQHWMLPWSAQSHTDYLSKRKKKNMAPITCHDVLPMLVTQFTSKFKPIYYTDRLFHFLHRNIPATYIMFCM